MFQVNVIDGDSAVFDAVVFGEKHQGTINYLRNQFTGFGEHLSAAGQAFVQGAQAIFEQFNNSEAMRAARRAVQKVKGVFMLDEVRTLWDLVEIQNAGLKMQRWIMAEPTVRELYHAQGCDGYSESYVDMNPGCIGEAHYDYRRVMNGIVQDTAEEWQATFYMDDLHEGDRELTLDEQVDILNTWDVVRHMLKHGKEDPTSPFGGSL